MKKLFLCSILGFICIQASADYTTNPVNIERAGQQLCMVGTDTMKLVSSDKSSTYNVTVKVTTQPAGRLATTMNRNYKLTPLASVTLGCTGDFSNTYGYEIVNYYK